LFLPNSLLHRCHLLGVTVLSFTLLLWLLLRPRRAAADGMDDSPTFAARIVRLVGWLAIFLMVVSAVANVYGNVSLAEMLTDALLFSSYVGLALFAGANVLTSLLHIVFTLQPVAQFHLIEQNGTAILRGVNRVLKTTAIIGWLMFLLNQFRLLQLFQKMIDGAWDYKLSFGELSVSLGGVLVFFFSVLLAFWVARTVRFILREEVLPNMSLDRGVANSISSLTYYALMMIGLFVALAAAGFQVGQLTIIIGALGVGIGLGLQNVVNNFVSGLILMFERPVQPGDVIEVTGTTGTVRDIGMRATTVTTFEGADVVVPNGAILSEKLINWTLNNTNRRMEVEVGVAYGTDPKMVLELLAKITTETHGVISYPKPAVLFKGFGPSSLDFVIRAWTDNFNDWVNIHSNLTLRVHEAIVAAGIEIPFPQHDLHLRSIDPAITMAFATPPGTDSK
jgi:small-conductance mechanosensitive channel